MAQTKRHGTAYAKTTRPVIGSSVQRLALFSRLDGAPGRTAAWIYGPPGAGKSTLAASYIDARNLQCVWYQIDPDDADVASFFHYLRHAGRRLDGHRGRELPQPSGSQSVDSPAFARKFFRALFAHAKSPTALVFDNLPATSGPLLDALEAGFAEVPKHCCVLVTSRGSPPPRLARMQTSGELVCVGGTELRFAATELVEIANLRGIPVDLRTAQRLEERTQGWVAGIVLMLEHAKLSGRLVDLPEDAAPTLLFDYLAGEIFERFEPATQAFLSAIARLPRVSADVAEILTGDKRAGRLLRNLAHNDYFVREVRSEEGLTYVIHPLLRDFLRDRRSEYEPQADSTLRLEQAAARLESLGQSEDAIALLAECAAWENIATIIANDAPSMLAQGRGEVLRRWIELLPKALLDRDARLLQVSALTLIGASPRAARKRLEQAFDAFSADGNRSRMLACCRGIVDALLMEFDDLAMLDPWIVRLEALLNESSAESAASGHASTVATLLCAILARDPGRPALIDWLDRAHFLERTLSDAVRMERPLYAVSALAVLLRGEIARVKSSLATFDADSRTRGADGHLHPVRALAHLLDGEHEAAVQIAQAGLTEKTDQDTGADHVWLSAIAALGCLGLVDTAGARARITTLESAGAGMRRGDRSLVHWLHCRLAAVESDKASAHREAKAALGLAIETGAPWVEFLAQLELTQLHCYAGEQREAEAALRSAGALADTLACAPLNLTLRMTQAVLALAFGPIAVVQSALRSALAYGRGLGLKYVALLSPESVAALCAVALRDGIEPDYARTLVRAGKLAPPPNALRLRRWPWRFQLRTMGGFSIRREDTPLTFSGKGPGRPIELLKILIALGGQNVRADQIADALWPRVDADYAHKSFTIALHRLRRLLDDDDALVLRDARLSLNPALVGVDSWALEALLGEFDEHWRDPNRAAAETLSRCRDELAALYTGPFLPDESEHAAYIGYREQIRARVARALTRAVRRSSNAETLDVAEACYVRLIDADALCEAFHRGLMQLYQQRGDRVEALATFERLRTLLATRLGVSPSAETQAAYAQLNGQS